MTKSDFNLSTNQSDGKCYGLVAANAASLTNCLGLSQSLRLAMHNRNITITVSKPSPREPTWQIELAPLHTDRVVHILLASKGPRVTIVDDEARPKQRLKAQRWRS